MHIDWLSFIVYFGLLDRPLKISHIDQKLLSTNGTYLYEKYKGRLLIITGVDVDGGLYPSTFAVVEGKTKASWRWFISRIYYLISNVHQNKRITFISDQIKGIPNACKVSWPSPYSHRTV